MHVPFLNLKLQHEPLREEIAAAIEKVIDASAFAGGPFVAEFEADFARYCETEYAIGVGNGTDALWFSLLALGIGPGDEVITVPSTFMATAEAISFCGARPVFVDIDKQTYTMDPEALARAVTPKTRAIVPVHLFGQTADLAPIITVARKHGLFVVEDACQAHGAEYQGRRAGSLGDAGCFSFYPGKNLGALGEGGAVVTNNSELAGKIRTLRDHGQARKYHHSVIGWNGRMDGIQAAALQIKLRHLDGWNSSRREWAAVYSELLAGVSGVITPTVAGYAKHVFHIFAIRVNDRVKLAEALAERGIATAIHYPIPVHLQEAYRFLGLPRGSFPVAEQCADEFLSLPMFPELTREQITYVSAAVREQLQPANAANAAARVSSR
jgi:dTDP-4-amino-4,6-dideoxygalactose transaminase